MTRYFDISRTHALLIDSGGPVGILGGLALESIVNPTPRRTRSRPRSSRAPANYALWRGSGASPPRAS
jgi:hypothetical protein